MKTRHSFFNYLFISFIFILFILFSDNLVVASLVKLRKDSLSVKQPIQKFDVSLAFDLECRAASSVRWRVFQAYIVPGAVCVCASAH